MLRYIYKREIYMVESKFQRAQRKGKRRERERE